MPFDAVSGLLQRSVSQVGRDTVTTRYSDWREVGKLRLAFSIRSDQGDSRNRTDMDFETMQINLEVDKGRFSVPTMARHTARIEGDTTSMAFELINNHIFVQAQVDGKTLHMLLDTGGLNILVPAAARRLGLGSEGKLEGRGVGESSVDVAVAKARELRLGGLQFDAPMFYVIDLGQLDQVEGVPVDGIVGYEVFRRFGVDIDYAAQRLTLSDLSAFQAPDDATSIPFELADRTPIVRGRIAGIDARLIIDTGSRANLTLHGPFARENRFAEIYSAAPEAVTGWGVGGAAMARPVRLPSLELAGFTLSDIAADLYTGKKGAFADPEISANLGGGVLRRFRVAFDYEHRRMYLRPNTTDAAHDDYDRSGLWLMRDADALRVTAVANGSAAHRAGIRVGQRISHIDGQATAERSLSDWRERLRSLPAGTEVVMQMHDANPVTLRLSDRIPALANRPDR